MTDAISLPLTGEAVILDPPTYELVLPFPPALKKVFVLVNGGIRAVRRGGMRYQRLITPIVREARIRHSLLYPLNEPLGIHVSLYLPGRLFGDGLADYEKVIHRMLVRTELIQSPKLIRRCSAEFFTQHKQRPHCRVRIETHPWGF